VLESETTQSDDLPKEGNALYEEPVEMEEPSEESVGKDKPKTVIGSAKDMVMNIVKKAAQALGKTGIFRTYFLVFLKMKM